MTLVCEDGQQVEAHKVVLASSSPFFMNLLKNTKHARPLIYMRGLKTNDLTTILNFLYVGEANIFQEDLDSFLALAEELQLKGFTGDSTKRTEDLKDFKRDFQTRGEIPRREQKSLQPRSNINTALKQNLDTTLAIDGTAVIEDNQNLDRQILSMITKSYVNADKGKFPLYTCSVCEKQAPHKLNMMRQVEANHITGVSHECDICGKTSRSKHGLLQHKKLYHSI